MLTFTHTYLLNLAYEKINLQPIPLNRGELVLGNVIPDFITHLGRSRFQAIAHDLRLLSENDQRSDLRWGAIFHVLCDNYSTLGRINFSGSYHSYAKNGFIEQRARYVKLNDALHIPKRRILQCAFDILVIRSQRLTLIQLLRVAETFLHENFENIIHEVGGIYNIAPVQLIKGLQRFSFIYGDKFIDYASLEEYRLFPLIRSLLKLDSLADPHLILQQIRNHPELMDLVESNMDLIRDNWVDLLDETANAVLQYQGLKSFLRSTLANDH